jgi:hypothetical protein
MALFNERPLERLDAKLILACLDEPREDFGTLRVLRALRWNLVPKPANQYKRTPLSVRLRPAATTTGLPRSSRKRPSCQLFRRKFTGEFSGVAHSQDMGFVTDAQRLVRKTPVSRIQDGDGRPCLSFITAPSDHQRAAWSRSQVLHENARRPVISRPTMRELMLSVPS